MQLCKLLGINRRLSLVKRFTSTIYAGDEEQTCEVQVLVSCSSQVSRSDGTLEPVTGSSPAASDLLWVNFSPVEFNASRSQPHGASLRPFPYISVQSDKTRRHTCEQECVFYLIPCLKEAEPKIFLFIHLRLYQHKSNCSIITNTDEINQISLYKRED